jgi:acyl-CoA thioesterase-1
MDINGPRVTALADYEKNLRELVRQLKATGAKLVWASTTPVPEGADGRVPGDEDQYNAVAARVMRENGVAIDDLNAAAHEKLAEIQWKKNVHYSPEGYRFLAEKVAASITAQLGGK